MNKRLIFQIVGVLMAGLGGYLLGRNWEGSALKGVLVITLLYVGGFLQL